MRCVYRRLTMHSAQLNQEGFFENEDEQILYISQMERVCLSRQENSSAKSRGDKLACPMVWDGLLCWPPTAAGDIVSLPCPPYITGFDIHGVATKRCMPDGEWFWSEQSNATWTNFSLCYSNSVTNVVVPFPGIDNAPLIAQYVPFVKAVSHIGYGVSLATLLIAFCILASFKKLRCPRNKLHMHLFVSFIFRAFTTLLKDSLFIKGVGLPSDFTVKDGEAYFLHESEHSWQCKFITSCWQYFIIANYSWILMEGLYLHNLIFVSVFSDTSSITSYIVLGWGSPLLFVIPWICVRAMWENTFCWTTNNNAYHFLLIKGPTTVSVLVNLFLFINIVRVLLSKLRASISEETRRFRYRRWAKSTLVLVPLFGVHYTVYLTLSYIGIDGKAELVWLFIDQLFASFQGFFVAVLYCLWNGEVRMELSKKWRHLRENSAVRRGSIPLHQTPHKNTSVSRSYLAAIFNKRTKRLQQHNNACTTESCMTSLVSTDLNSTVFCNSYQTQVSDVTE